MIVKNLHKAFKDNILYEDLSFQIQEGEIFALIGPNGAGKTTLMKMILGWEKDYQGEIIIDEEKIVSYSPESPEFPGILTGKECLELFIDIRKSDDKAEDLLTWVGLKADNKTPVERYSKGMKQRLGLAQALIANPDIVLLDEPAAGLDYFGQIQMQKLMLSLKEQGKAILLNSHLLYDVEKICDRGIIIMDKDHFRSFERKDFDQKSLGDMFLDLAWEVRKNEVIN